MQAYPTIKIPQPETSTDDALRSQEIVICCETTSIQPPILCYDDGYTRTYIIGDYIETLEY